MDWEKFKKEQEVNLLKLKECIAKTREKYGKVFYFDNEGKLQMEQEQDK